MLKINKKILYNLTFMVSERMKWFIFQAGKSPMSDRYIGEVKKDSKTE